MPASSCALLQRDYRFLYGSEQLVFRLERNAARVHSDRRLFHGRAFHQAEKRSGVYVPQRREPRLGYTAARIKTLLPVLIIGYIIAIVVCTSFYYPDYKTQDVLVMIVNSIWEFLGFHAAGLRSTGNEFFNLNGRCGSFPA